ncbi:MAG: N-acetylmuramoyl-L-alanine amidase [Streptomyces sp.]|uniref:N-acetylmuramoyl-L-alanine amidase n=1 Tax=Streptomyces sp. TaxID=1931 RepID=UPI003D6A086A
MAVAVATPPQSNGGRSAVHAALHTTALETRDGGKGLSRREVKPFSMLGVSWPDEKAALRGTAQVRTRGAESGAWSDWKTLKAQAGAGARAASEPLWAGPSDAVEVRVTTKDGTSVDRLPQGMRLDMVDPGRPTAGATKLAAEPAAYVAEDPTASPSDGASPSDAASPSGSASPSDAASPSGSASPSPTGPPTAPPSTVTTPPIVSRAQWGADESLVTGPPAYAEKVKAAVVLHEAGTNDYSCADSPAIVRAIQLYDTKSKGLSDIGRNFVVDRCGTVFEGRAGGKNLPVVGQHTVGFDSGTVGISVLGDMSTEKPSPAALESIARVAAWRLGQYGLNTRSDVVLTADADNAAHKEGDRVSGRAVFGHYQLAGGTSPGQKLADKLDQIRTIGILKTVNSAHQSADTNRDGLADLTAGTPKGTAAGAAGAGTVTVVPGGKDGLAATAKKTLSQSSAGVPGASEAGDGWGTATAYGDIDYDGYADLVVGAPGEDDTSGRSDTGSVTVLHGPSFTTARQLTIPSAERTSGEKLGSAVTVADFNADGKSEVFAVAPGVPGSWWVFDGTTGAVVKHGNLQPVTGDSAYTQPVPHADATTTDLAGEGYQDVLVAYVEPGGKARTVGVLGGATGPGEHTGTVHGLSGGRSIASGDIDGDGDDDIVTGQPDSAEVAGSFPEMPTTAGGQVTVHNNDGWGWFRTHTIIAQNSTGYPRAGDTAGDSLGADVAVGDVDFDGYAEVLAGIPGEDIGPSHAFTKDVGGVLYFRGSATGATGTGARYLTQDTDGVPGAAESGDAFGSAVTLADFSGWGRADLAIGVQGENAGDGTILKLDSVSSDIELGGTYYGRTKLGTPAGLGLGRHLKP